MVFFSYSRTDLVAASALRTPLKQASLRVFRDEHAIRLGDRWVTRLQGILQGCFAFLSPVFLAQIQTACWSPVVPVPEVRWQGKNC